MKAKDLFPATPDLPLRVVAAVKRTGNAGQSRIHLLNVEGTAVGCGWRPAASLVQELSVLDYMTEQEAYGKCERCFKRHGFPADWALEPAEPRCRSPVGDRALATKRMGTQKKPLPGPSAQTGILRKWRVCQTVLRKWRYQSAHPFFSF